MLLSIVTTFVPAQVDFPLFLPAKIAFGVRQFLIDMRRWMRCEACVFAPAQCHFDLQTNHSSQIPESTVTVAVGARASRFIRTD
jgi:hypothetical protein